MSDKKKSHVSDSKAIEGPPVPGGTGEKAQDFKGTIRTLAKRLKMFKIPILLVTLFSVVGTAFMIVGPRLLGNAITELANGFFSKVTGGSGIDFDKIAEILLMLLSLYVISLIFTYIQGWLMTGVSQKLTYQLRKEVAEKINCMPMSYFDEQNHGETLSLITNDIDTISVSLNQSATQIITSFVTVVGILIMMLSIDWAMTLIALAVLAVSMLLMSIIISQSQKHFQNQQEYLGHVNGQVEEIFGGQNIVRVFNAEKRVKQEFDKDNAKLYHSTWKAQFLSGLMFPVAMFVGQLGYIAVAVVGGVFVSSGRLEAGFILTFVQYNQFFSQSVTQLAQVSSLLQSTAAAAERVFAFLSLKEEEQTVANPVKLDQVEGYVSFQQVSFGYHPDNIIIKHLNTEVEPGQKIAIVGPTGAGKTTIIKLLMRFYHINGGHILLDGHDIQNFEKHDLRQIFGMVLQDTWLFHGTIMENIRYGRRNATDQEVIDAAKAAHAHHFIKTLPGSYHMMLNEETTNVSQGQKQLLTIARAILADPKILILDEATSSVDTRTEIRIQKAMDHLMEGRTSFIIAHRLSTIRDADRILVLRDGDIVEQGNHEQLIAQNGFYTSLYNAQFEAS